VKKTKLLALLFPLAVATAACNPYLAQHTTAPPGRTANLEEVSGFWALDHYKLEISRGVAVTLTCRHSGPCRKLEVTSEDSSIVDVRMGSLAALRAFGPFLEQKRQAAAFVIVGKTPGKTKLRVRAKGGNRAIHVTVVEPAVR